jgi:hypothetical protein
MALLLGMLLRLTSILGITEHNRNSRMQWIRVGKNLSWNFEFENIMFLKNLQKHSFEPRFMNTFAFRCGGATEFFFISEGVISLPLLRSLSSLSSGAERTKWSAGKVG